MRVVVIFRFCNSLRKPLTSRRARQWSLSCIIPTDLLPLSTLCDQRPLLKSLFESLFCIPASSAPVDSVLEERGLLMRPHRVACRMTQWKCWCFWLVTVGYKLQMMP